MSFASPAFQVRRSGDVVGPAERSTGLGERAARKPVPRREHLVVTRRVDASRPRGVELLPDRRDRLGVGLARQVENALPLEVRPPVDAPVPSGHRGVGLAQHLPQLVGSPDEELALVALGVGVGRGVEAAGRIGHLAEQVVERLLRDAAVLGVAEGEPAVEVQ